MHRYERALTIERERSFQAKAAARWMTAVAIVRVPTRRVFEPVARSPAAHVAAACLKGTVPQ
jgi:hypothetical protein